MRPLGDALSTAGFACRAIRLPGHATTIDDLARSRRGDWIEAVETAVRVRPAGIPQVAIVGMSLGALLALAVAMASRVRVDALVLCGTPLRFADERIAWLRWLGRIPGVVRPDAVVRKRRARDILDDAARARSQAYDAMPLPALVELVRLRANVVSQLDRITQPTLVLHGRHDHTAPAANVDVLCRGLRRARLLEATIFERSAHVITEDAERDAVAARVITFLDQIAPKPPA